MIILFDTCIVLDFLLNRKEFAEMAEELLILSAEGEIHGVITVKSLMDIHYVLKHSLHDERKTRRAISVLLDALSLVDSKSSDALLALSSKITDFEDALMETAAVSIKADGIVTRNTKDYKESRIRVYEPGELLTQIVLAV